MLKISLSSLFKHFSLVATICPHCFDSNYVLEAGTLTRLIDLRIKSLTYLSLNLSSCRFLLDFSKYFHPKLASVKHSLLPYPLISCISVEQQACIKAEHYTSNLRNGSQICFRSVKVLL